MKQTLSRSLFFGIVLFFAVKSPVVAGNICFTDDGASGNCIFENESTSCSGTLMAPTAGSSCDETDGVRGQCCVMTPASDPVGSVENSSDSTWDTSYTDPIALTDPVSTNADGTTGDTNGFIPIDNAFSSGSAGAGCTKFGVAGMCMGKNDPCSSDIRFSDVCGDASLICCPTEEVPQSLRDAIENGTVASYNQTNIQYPSCRLTTNEPGICDPESDCKTGFTAATVCAPKGEVCCRAVENNSGGLGNTGSAPSTGTNPAGNTGSPVPTGTNTNPAAGNAGGGGVASNRVNPTGAATTTGGLYIPGSAETGLASGTVTSLVQNFMKWLLYMVGFIAIIAFVISGIQYLLAAGDAKMAETAKANMQYAIIGVIVALSALIIIRAIQAVLAGSLSF